MKKTKAENKKNGFTLIEILIIMTITSLLILGTISYYHQFTELKKLNNEISKLDDILGLFRKKAIVGDYGGLSCTGQFNGYQFTFSSTSYSVYFWCNGSSRTLVKTYTLESGLRLTDYMHFIFEKQSGRARNTNATDINPIAQQTINQDITNANIAKCNQILIDSTGVINTSGSCP